ncbi:MAG: hypothetical protein JWQ81_6521 [Amycolatopsis sp.]|uniref:hypothetical protein n=1 Tax=Amycolatopsis sp. TaxID=37632 RepID=UPI00260FF76C|nr:hypothetical protein [Amycolatopsis sp.]MCU1685782.1 hypothetical protein [Amycolatopsis sp.]
MTDTKTRTDHAVTWAVAHFGELTGVTVPVVLAATVDVWFLLAGGAVAVWWGFHDLRLARQAKALAGAGQPPAQLTATTTAAPGSGSADHHGESA